MNGMEPMTRFVCLDCPVNPDYNDKEHWGTYLCPIVCHAVKKLQLTYFCVWLDL